MRRNGSEIRTAHVGADGVEVLRLRICVLERRVAQLESEASLCRDVNAVLGHTHTWGKVKGPSAQLQILGVIQRHAASLGVAHVISHVGISRTRYKSWRRALRLCPLTQQPANKCPSRHPSQLTTDEVEAMRRLVHDQKYGHFSISALSAHAKRTGEIFAERHTWYKYVRERGWKRPLIRKKKLYKLGVRAALRDQIWHVDVSHWEFPDGTKAYIQTVIDKFSCIVLAARICENISGINTVEAIKEAIRASRRQSTTVTTLLSDGGSENKNHHVKDFLGTLENFDQAIARIDIRLSNAGSECFFRSLKSNYLRKQLVNSIAELKEKICFYVVEYNTIVPHNRHSGGTPHEIYNGLWGQDQIESLNRQAKLAQMQRRQSNARARCQDCHADLAS